MFSTDQVERLAQCYAEARGIALSTLGRLAVGNSAILARIRTGHTTVRTLKRFVQYLSDHWPADLEWPVEIPRPAPSEPESPATHEAA